MQKTLEELKFVLEQRTQDFSGDPVLCPKLLALCLSSRKNMCIHPDISQEEDRATVDAKCRELISPWNRLKDEPTDKCDFFEAYFDGKDCMHIPEGVYTLDDLRDYGRSKGICPYYLVRDCLMRANVIVYNYSYLLDPKISNIVSVELQKDSIVIFDECHNIDNVCIESLSININNRKLDMANLCIKRLEEKIKDQNRLSTETLKRHVADLT